MNCFVTVQSLRHSVWTAAGEELTCVYLVKCDFDDCDVSVMCESESSVVPVRSLMIIIIFDKSSENKLN